MSKHLVPWKRSVKGYKTGCQKVKHRLGPIKAGLMCLLSLSLTPFILRVPPGSMWKALSPLTCHFLPHPGSDKGALIRVLAVVEVWTTEKLHSGLCPKYRMLGATGQLLSNRALLWGSHGQAAFPDLAAPRAEVGVHLGPPALWPGAPVCCSLSGCLAFSCVGSPFPPQEGHCSLPHIPASSPVREDLASGFKAMWCLREDGLTRNLMRCLFWKCVCLFLAVLSSLLCIGFPWLQGLGVGVGLLPSWAVCAHRGGPSCCRGLEGMWAQRFWCRGFIASRRVDSF